MDLREEVLKRCDIAIKEMENSNCSSSTKEHSIARSQACKQILEISTTRTAGGLLFPAAHFSVEKLASQSTD